MTITCTILTMVGFRSSLLSCLQGRDFKVGRLAERALELDIIYVSIAIDINSIKALIRNPKLEKWGSCADPRNSHDDEHVLSQFNTQNIK